MNDSDGIIGLIIGIIFGALLIIFNLPPNIKNYEKEPYCETQKVAGKEFTRCLKAVEVPNEIKP